jgi:hypothetical protein
MALGAGDAVAALQGGMAFDTLPWLRAVFDAPVQASVLGALVLVGAEVVFLLSAVSFPKHTKMRSSNSESF